MSATGPEYRVYLRENYKGVKQDLTVEGKPHAKKDIYAELRRRYLSGGKAVAEASKNTNHLSQATLNQDMSKKPPVTEPAVKKPNFKAWNAFYTNVTKL